MSGTSTPKRCARRMRSPTMWSASRRGAWWSMSRIIDAAHGEAVSSQPGHRGAFVHRLGDERTAVLRVEDGADGPAHHTRYRCSRRDHDPLLPEILRNILRKHARPSWV